MILSETKKVTSSYITSTHYTSFQCASIVFCAFSLKRVRLGPGGRYSLTLFFLPGRSESELVEFMCDRESGVPPNLVFVVFRGVTLSPIDLSWIFLER